MKPLLSCLLVLMAALPAAAGVLSGRVASAAGEPLHGAMVRVTDEARGVSEVVFSGADGRFVLATALTGKLQVRARLPYFRDAVNSVELAAGATLDLTLQPMTDTAEISASLPAAYHFGSLPFEQGDDASFNRFQFQRDCLSCHQMGNPLTRNARTPEVWATTIERMHRYLGNFDAALRDQRAVLLSRGFTDAPLAVRPQFPVDAALASAKIYEFRLERAGVPHDVIFNPQDGLLYTVDQALDHMAITDPATGATEYVLQTGGAGMAYREVDAQQQAVVGEFEPGNRHGPHSLAMGRDGKYYVTNTGSNSIGVFNPKTRQWEASHRIPREFRANYPHTIRAARSGMVWFTLAGSEKVGRLDPGTGRFTILDLPRVQPGGISGGTQPYGIDVHPHDDAIWYGRLFGDRIGRIDPDTLAITEHASPVRGPRRMRFDASGTLWVTGYSEGQLARIEPKSFTSKVYDMPAFAEGYRAAPYALGVHPQTQEIWINENMTDRVFRFLPDEERFVVYPVPLSGTYTRDMTFMADGRVCASNNPIPAVALEGGVLKVLCIDAAYQQAATTAASR